MSDCGCSVCIDRALKVRQSELDAARARIAELEAEVGRLREAHEFVQRWSDDTGECCVCEDPVEQCTEPEDCLGAMMRAALREKAHV